MGTRYHGAPVILNEMMLPDGFDPVSSTKLSEPLTYLGIDRSLYTLNI
ncbi:unnamed protein product [Schistosoma margrebowiei]|uniref:Uncharacterized protein n=1 Tax=Schistosoma margrebowiei TaxID=48269 RepID=A0A183MDF5_9TREM|nr:unnamed protein product [Schistosoma margrebowiei]